MNKASITQFKQFLIKEGAKEKYLEMIRLRAKQDEKRSYEKFYLHDFILRQSPGSWISAVMPWDETKEGFKFWFILSQKWHKERDSF